MAYPLNWVKHRLLGPDALTNHGNGGSTTIKPDSMYHMLTRFYGSKPVASRHHQQPSPFPTRNPQSCLPPSAPHNLEWV